MTKIGLSKDKDSQAFSVRVSHRDMYHGIGPMDPERLNVFRTVKEITGKATAICSSGSVSERNMGRLFVHE